MNDILVTIWAGLPLTAIFCGIAITLFCIFFLYIRVIAILLEKGHEWAVTFLIAIPLFLFISSLSYILGHL
jgi:hypothetical protein